MQLSAEQLKAFDEQGLRLPAELLLGGGDRAASHRGRADPARPTARRSGARRPARRAPPSRPTPSARCSACWCSHPRLVGPLKQYFGEDVYVHQFKLNAKAAFEGDVWQWHQDYGTWARDDGMPQARAMNIAVFLDEVMPINGPLLLIPGSHKQGVFEAGHDKLDHVLSAVDARQGHRDAALPPTPKPRTARASSRRPESPARC